MQYHIVFKYMLLSVQKYTQYLALRGQLCGVYSEYSGENL